MFISPFPVPLTAYNALYDRPPLRRIWVIKNGRTAPIQQVVQQRTLPIAGRSISTVLLSQNQGTLYRIYRRALDADAQFRFAAIPNGFRLLPREAFDPIYQTALFELAESRAAAGYPWLDRPPSQLPSAERAPPPRRFKVVKGPPGEEFTTEGFFGGLDLLR
ncbi:MAG: patatin, partial [Pseudomonadota bacterium]